VQRLRLQPPRCAGLSSHKQRWPRKPCHLSACQRRAVQHGG